MEEIISYIMETPENVNGNILREKLEDFQKGGGGSSVLDDLIEGKSGIHLVSNVKSVADSAISKISQHLESVELPNATTIGNSAFFYSTALTSVNLPNATTIDGAAFSQCSALTSVNLPNATTIGEAVFFKCSALTSINLPKVTSIGVNAFKNISSTAVINIGAAEGEIEGAPWGAPEGVTINYNVTTSTSA